MQRSELVNLLFQPSLDFGSVFNDIASQADALIGWFNELQEASSQENHKRMLVQKTPAGIRRKKRCRVSTIQELDENTASPQLNVQGSSSLGQSTVYRPGRTAAMAASMKIKTISTDKLNNKLRRPSNSKDDCNTTSLSCSSFGEDEPLAKMIRLDEGRESKHIHESKRILEISESNPKTRGRTRKGKTSKLSTISISSDRSASMFSSGKQSEAHNMDTSDFPADAMHNDKISESKPALESQESSYMPLNSNNSSQSFKVTSDVESIPRKQSLRGAHNSLEAKKISEEYLQKIDNVMEVDDKVKLTPNAQSTNQRSLEDNKSTKRHTRSFEKELQNSCVVSNDKIKEDLIQASLIPNNQKSPIILIDKLCNGDEEVPLIKDKTFEISSNIDKLLSFEKKLESSVKKSKNVKSVVEKELKVLLPRFSPQISQNKSSTLQQKANTQNMSLKYSNEENTVPEISVYKNINSSFRSSPDVLADISNLITPVNNYSNEKELRNNEDLILKKNHIIKDCNVNLSQSLISKYLPDFTHSLKQSKFLKKSPVVFSPYTKETVRTKVAAYEKLRNEPLEEEEEIVAIPPPSGRVTRTKTRAMKAAAANACANLTVEKDSAQRDKALMKTLSRKSLSKAKTTLNNKSRADLILSTDRQKIELQSASKYANVLTTVDTFLPKSAANTSATDDSKKKEEELRRRAEKEAEAKRKREERLLQMKLEKKKKWEEKMQKVHVTQENFEKQRMVKKRLLEEKDVKTKLALMERDEKLREETQKKKMHAQLKGLEIEERRKQEEAARLAKLKEQEEEQAILNATRKKEQQELEKKRAQEEKEAQKLLKKNSTKKIGKGGAYQIYENNIAGLNATYNLNDSLMDYGLDDTNDSSDDESVPKRAIPSWVNRITKLQFESIESLPIAALRAFVSIDKTTPDLKQFFKKADPRWDRRNSSAIWDTPPRYSQLPKF